MNPNPSRRGALGLGGLASILVTTSGLAKSAAAQPSLPLAKNDGPNAVRSVTPLDAMWSFGLNDAAKPSDLPTDRSGWADVTLPHCYDGQTGAVGWYETDIQLSSRTDGRRLVLDFGAAASIATVYVNNVRVGEHRGGFTRFRFDVSDLLREGRNRVSVRTDSRGAGDVIPLGGDFTKFGGLHRSVQLLSVDEVHIDLEDYGGPGVYITVPHADAASAVVRVRARVRNSGDARVDIVLRHEVRSPDGARVSVHQSGGALDARGQDEWLTEMSVSSPRLWRGRIDPAQHVLITEVEVDGRIVDRLTQNFGIRTIAIDAARGTVLNGVPYAVHGVNLHSGRAGQGFAMLPEQIEQDFQLILDMGATGVRLVHYPHDPHAYQSADKHGLLCWTEIPLNGSVNETEAFRDNVRQQMREMVLQHHNHPSVYVWGIGNELYATTPDVLDAMQVAHDEAKRLDPWRPTAYAHCCQDDDHPKTMITDVIAFNRYFDWYPNEGRTLAGWLESVQDRFPDRPFAIGEYGAGGSIRQQSNDLRTPVADGGWHPEGYQALAHERSWQAIEGSRRVPWGAFVWVMFDFPSAGRSEGDRPGVNDKGLVSEDRLCLKDAYHFYRARWTTRPTLHLAAKRHRHRRHAAATAKVYANLSRVTLTLNGDTLGSRAVIDGAATWDLVLQPGVNRIEVASGDLRDAATWVFDPLCPLDGPPYADILAPELR